MRHRNYYEGQPRAQAAVDGILGGMGGSILGGILGSLITGGSRGGAVIGALAGGMGGARYAAGRDRPGFSKAQQEAAGKGAMWGRLIPGVGSGAGTFFWTERTSNPASRRAHNPQAARLKNSLLR